MEINKIQSHKKNLIKILMKTLKEGSSLKFNT